VKQKKSFKLLTRKKISQKKGDNRSLSQLLEKKNQQTKAFQSEIDLRSVMSGTTEFCQFFLLSL
jgi:hypothetical protein